MAMYIKHACTCILSQKVWEDSISGVSYLGSSRCAIVYRHLFISSINLFPTSKVHVNDL